MPIGSGAKHRARLRWGLQLIRRPRRCLLPQSVRSGQTPFFLARGHRDSRCTCPRPTSKWCRTGWIGWNGSLGGCWPLGTRLKRWPPTRGGGKFFKFFSLLGKFTAVSFVGSLQGVHGFAVAARAWWPFLLLFPLLTTPGWLLEQLGALLMGSRFRTAVQGRRDFDNFRPVSEAIRAHKIQPQGNAEGRRMALRGRAASRLRVVSGFMPQSRAIEVRLCPACCRRPAP